MGRVRLATLSLDGFDGAGKSTLAEAMRVKFSELGLTAAIIGHSIETSNNWTSALTEALKIEDASVYRLSADAASRIRAVRLAERIRLSNFADIDVCIFDRFVWSDLGSMPSEYRPYYGAIVGGLLAKCQPLVAVHLVTTFDVLYDRIEHRHDASPRERQGVAKNLAAHRRFTELQDWDDYGLRGAAEHIVVDSAEPIEQLVDRCLVGLAPLLHQKVSPDES